MKIEAIRVKEITDSRGEPTIEVELKTSDGSFVAKIPSGKSRGANEVCVLSPAEASKKAGEIKKEIQDKDFETIENLDRFLIDLDGTSNKKQFGGNLILGISIAFSRALAAAAKKEPWQILRQEFFKNVSDEPPVIFSNLINGGAHAKNNLNFQEYLVLARPINSVEETISELKDFYKNLGVALKKEYKLENIPLGDEGGYAPKFKSNLEPLLFLNKQIESAGLKNKFLLGIDAAASEFNKEGDYYFEEKKISREELREVYIGYFAKLSALYSIEDPFAEIDETGFKSLMKVMPEKLIIGDDLTTTNTEIIANCASNGLINGVIIKPNQIGSLTETCAAINMAHNRNLKCVVSHRSGETDDSFIIQIAKAAGVYGVKIGAPVSHRLPKFEELIRLYV
ncbi:MAG: hypothetical protein AAB432_02220 [Patescibacteria group bacterium]